MTGFCPGTTGPPDCYAGPKWTPNDPMFFLHHAVSPFASLLVLMLNSPLLQMIDRLWAQWQLVAPQNAVSFVGGSVPARETYAIYQTFPNGGPPFLHVGQTRSYNSRHSPFVIQFESVLPSDGLWQNVTVFDVMDTRNEVLCYTYE
jgi:tyrosinase